MILHSRLVILSKRACVYLEGRKIIDIRPTFAEILSWSYTPSYPHIRSGLSMLCPLEEQISGKIVGLTIKASKIPKL